MDKRLDNSHERVSAQNSLTLLKAGALFPALVFLIVFFVFPLCLVGITVFRTTSGPFFSSTEFITLPYFLRITGFTFYQAFFSTLLALIIGLPGGIILGRYNFPGKKILHSLTAIPFMLPSIIIVLGFVLIYGNNGIINRGLMNLFNSSDPILRILYSKYAIILAHGFYNFPLTIRYVSAYVSNMESHQENAAALLGAGRIRIFFTITLPRIIPIILSAASIIFIFCFLSFALILVLGGGPKTTTIEVEVYRLARVHVDMINAALLGIASTFFALLVTYIYTKLQNKLHHTELRMGALSPVKITGKTKKALTGGYLLAVAAFALVPLLAVFINSLIAKTGYVSNSHFGFQVWKSLFTGKNSILSISSIGNSMLVAISASAISVYIGFSLSYVIIHSKLAKTELIETILMLPIGISSILLSLGYLSVKSYFNLQAETSVIFIIIAHAVIAYPFVLRSVLSSYRKIPQNLMHSAALLGASPLKRFVTIEFPLVRNSLLASTAFSFALSMGEINATLMLSEGRFLTIPLAIYRLIGSYNFAGACALGTVLVCVGIFSFYIIDKLGGTDAA